MIENLINDIEQAMLGVLNKRANESIAKGIGLYFS